MTTLAGIDRNSLDSLAWRALLFLGQTYQAGEFDVAVVGDAGGSRTRGQIRYSRGREREGKEILKRGVEHESQYRYTIYLHPKLGSFVVG